MNGMNPNVNNRALDIFNRRHLGHSIAEFNTGKDITRAANTARQFHSDLVHADEYEVNGKTLYPLAEHARRHELMRISDKLSEHSEPRVMHIYNQLQPHEKHKLLIKIGVDDPHGFYGGESNTIFRMEMKERPQHDILGMKESREFYEAWHLVIDDFGERVVFTGENQHPDFDYDAENEYGIPVIEYATEYNPLPTEGIMLEEPWSTDPYKNGVNVYFNKFWGNYENENVVRLDNELNFKIAPKTYAENAAGFAEAKEQLLDLRKRRYELLLPAENLEWLN